MTKNDFRDYLLYSGIRRVQVISHPDYNGGNTLFCLFNEECDDYERADFEYIEYDGDASEVVRDRGLVFYEHFEPFHEEPRDVPYKLWELVMADELVEY